MDDPTRHITDVLAALLKAWVTEPDMTLGELIEEVRPGDKKLTEVPDTEWAELLNAYATAVSVTIPEDPR